MPHKRLRPLSVILYIRGNFAYMAVNFLLRVRAVSPSVERLSVSPGVVAPT
jgi:hypothetical protein